MAIHYDEVNLRRAPIRDAENLDRKVAKLERRCANMAREMERKDNGKAAAVDRHLMGTSTLFTRRVAEYRQPEKFKVPQI